MALGARAGAGFGVEGVPGGRGELHRRRCPWGTSRGLLLLRGLQKEPAARATAVSYLQSVFASLWGALVLGEIPEALTLAGATLIVSSTLLLLDWRKGR
jgi:hypothetical protein